MNQNKKKLSKTKLSIVNYQLSIFLIVLFFTLPLKAQVNIGSDTLPHSFSILELTTSLMKGGLRLPQLTTDAISKLNTTGVDAAQGLVVYNTDTNCLEFWNGATWISLCDNILPTLEVDPEDMTFDGNGNVTSSATNKVTVTTNQPNWTATITSITFGQATGWLTIAPTSGTDGQQFTITVASGATTVRMATVTVTAGDLTKDVTVVQFPNNYADSPAPANITTYVGAFWKHNQTGERLIRIPRPTTGTVNVADGVWTATVISGSDWITLDTQTTSDPNVGWLPGADEESVDNGNDTGFDANHAVVNGSNTVIGLMDATTPQIYFRIGLKNTIASDAHRYGLVLLSYNNNTKTQRIWIRQGDAADYLFRGNDPVGDGSDIAFRTANLCRQYLPYNIKDPKNNVSTTLGDADAILPVNGGVPVDYPTQSGYMFLWNYSRQAFPPHIADIIHGWDESIYGSGDWDGSVTETCPSGYRRPNDGPQLNTTGNVDGSEMRQSLYLSPKSGNGFDFMNYLSNTVWGYYADGFFDRRFITEPGGMNSGTSSSVSVGNNQIAHIGRLLYNPYNNASLFFPAAGWRDLVNGALNWAGVGGIYWSSSSFDAENSWFQGISSDGAYQSKYWRSYAFPVRCVINN